MTDPAPAKRLEDLFDNGSTVMVMTMIGHEHSSRPMTVVAVDGHRLNFLVDKTAEWTEAVASGAAVVHVTLSDVRKNDYVALNGSASITEERAEIERLWNPAASAFFSGKDDPNVAVMRFDATDGQYWDSPSGRLGSLVAMVKAAVGGHDDAGDHGPVATT